MTRKGFHIVTFGCQMNARDSRIMSCLLEKEGLRAAGKLEDAGLLIVNTCHIREHAEQRAMSFVGRLKEWRERDPDRILVLAGCVAEADGANLLERFRHLDAVVGPAAILRLPGLVRSLREGGGRLTATGKSEISVVPECPEAGAGMSRSSAKIMEGCDMNCAFCVVPAVRGRARSRPFDEVVDQVEKMVACGVREIILLGQAVNAYGVRAGAGKDFPGLLRRLERVEDLRRVRFTSPHPSFQSDDSLRAMAECGKVCEHLHLPVQSGSDGVLKRMQRGYTSGKYLKLLERARSVVPGIVFTTDIIVGFPGETEEDFRATLDLIGKGDFDGAFTFKFSSRPGTPAADMPDEVGEDVKEERLARLNRLLAERSRARGAAMVGARAEVMVEHVSEVGWQGRLRSNRVVHVTGRAGGLNPGELAEIVIADSGDFALHGRPATPEAAAC